MTKEEEMRESFKELGIDTNALSKRIDNIVTEIEEKEMGDAEIIESLLTHISHRELAALYVINSRVMARLAKVLNRMMDVESEVSNSVDYIQ